ncbi:MAG TPA: acylphosphatase [Patescibacteria group bacterium]|nr:acylphosphatase [Patescibacteria group bacterium]
MVRVRIVVRGVVQGVGFRYFTLHLARGLGLGGYVKNRVDGAVEVEAEGEEGTVRAFLDDLSSGPRAAHVTGLEVENLQPGGGYNGFEVRF